jgi:hypothetical protein
MERMSGFLQLEDGRRRNLDGEAVDRSVLSLTR